MHLVRDSAKVKGEDQALEEALEQLAQVDVASAPSVDIQ